MRRAVAGTPLNIPAADYNKFIDTAEQFANTRGLFSATPQATQKTYNSITIKNSTGYDLIKGDPVGLDQPIITPTDNQAEFDARVVMDAVEPDFELHSGRYAVCLEPIPIDRYGRALLSGIVQVKMQVTTDNKNHDYADLVATTGSGTNDVIAPIPHGSSRIVWIDDTTGADVDAIIQLHCRQLPPLMVATSDELAGEITAKEIDSAGHAQGGDIDYLVVEYVPGS